MLSCLGLAVFYLCFYFIFFASFMGVQPFCSINAAAGSVKKNRIIVFV